MVVREPSEAEEESEVEVLPSAAKWLDPTRHPSRAIEDREAVAGRAFNINLHLQHTDRAIHLQWTGDREAISTAGQAEWEPKHHGVVVGAPQGAMARRW